VRNARRADVSERGSILRATHSQKKILKCLDTDASGFQINIRGLDLVRIEAPAETNRGASFHQACGGCDFLTVNDVFLEVIRLWTDCKQTRDRDRRNRVELPHRGYQTD